MVGICLLCVQICIRSAIHLFSKRDGVRSAYEYVCVREKLYHVAFLCYTLNLEVVIFIYDKFTMSNRTVKLLIIVPMIAVPPFQYTRGLRHK